MATQYVVLYRGDDDDAWTELPKYEGQNAAKQAALVHGKPGRYVAIPARSWDPVTLTIETNPRVKVVR